MKEENDSYHREREMAMNLKVLKLRAVLRAEEDGQLPAYLGSTIRGALGHAMREPVCVFPNLRCFKCEYATECQYTAHFCTAGHAAGSVNPFVLHVPLQNKVNWHKGDTLTFEITIFGRSTLAANYYIDSILRMGENGLGVSRLKFSPVQILNVLDHTLVWMNGNIWPQNYRPFLLHTEGRETDSVLLRFNSPTRVVVQKKTQKRLPFKSVMQAIVTRVRLLMHAYEGIVLEFEEDKLLKKAEEVEVVDEDWQFLHFERYSMTREGKLKLPSIHGYARYEGDITPFTPLLEIGEIIHIGKNTTHGFGKFELYYV